VFTFFLISVGHTTMILTNRNVDRLEIVRVEGGQQFVGDKGSITVWVKNRSAIPARRVLAALSPTVSKFKVPDLLQSSAFAGLDPLELRAFEAPWTPERRGPQKIPRALIASTFPFGMLRAWREFKSPLMMTVFAKPLRILPLPLTPQGSGAQMETDTYREHRSMRPGDSLRRIDWRVSSRSSELTVKSFETGQRQEQIALRWEQLREFTNLEDKISQMTAWVLDAASLGLPYSLKVGSQIVESAQGKPHRDRCLELLALLESEPS
jgi:uncharacterized protein (DUF58 family)